ncbi:hypothetical protein SNEBB_000784 [Seison nebaliae]|nr:hypothetical protein SNEBB_000784 [Seison nebaliae]
MSNGKEMNEELKSVLKEEKKFDDFYKQLRRRDETKGEEKKSYNFLFNSLLILYGVLVLIICLVIYWGNTLYAAVGVHMMSLQFDNLNELQMAECLLDMPEDWKLVFHLEEDCTACANVDSIDVIDNLKKELTKEEFIGKFAYSKRPVLVKGAANHWKAMKSFNLQQLSDFYREANVIESTESEDGWTCQFFPYRTDMRALGELFDKYEIGNLSHTDRTSSSPSEDRWYVGWSNCNHEVGEKFREHYQTPSFIPIDSESSKVDWLFIGTPGYGAPLHLDFVELTSWQAQIKGKKLWTLKPPPECTHICPTHHKLLVEPGDIVVIDTNYWYHKTLILGNEISLTIGTEYD